MKRKYILPLFLVFQIIVLQILKFFPEFVERFYSNGVYVPVSKMLRISLGWIPFSVGDVAYLLLILFILKWIIQNRKDFRKNWKNRLLKISGFISVVYFMFHFLWAFNYYREPLHEKMKIDKEFTEEELISFTRRMIVKTNEIHSAIESNDSLKIVMPYSQEEIFAMNVEGYKELSEIHPYFSYSHQDVKKSLWSLPLTYMGFSGYLNPFTGEAQVNDMMPMYQFPATANHEMAHQIGYASESEANFIGYLASVKNKDFYIRYSGYTMALRYCLNTLEKIEKGKSKPYLELIRPGILKNFEESKIFWESHSTFIEDGFEAFYDNFLKMNQQKDGMEGYSKFVGLIVNYYKTEKL